MLAANVLRAVLERLPLQDAEDARRAFVQSSSEASKEAIDLAVALSSAYPALKQRILSNPRDVIALARGIKVARDVRSYRKLVSALIADLSDHALVRKTLRTFAQREKLRVAARELLPLASSDIDVTARELSDLADVCIEVALAEALRWAEGRYGIPFTSQGERCGVAVLGMGKLGGRELNAGSDVDLIVFYESDEGDVKAAAEPSLADISLHEFFVRVTQRMVATLDDVTEDGIVWRVDMRLRPEGSKGPLVNALAAAERYYETWGRTWERAALLKSRVVAGDPTFGTKLTEALAPFVWRRAVNPAIAEEMGELLVRARLEASHDVERDLKIGPGGIRDVEFFVQSLQLIWGGKEARVRSANTLEALRRLRAHGYVTDREERELADGYLMFRRLEHRIQFATGLQTHSLPKDSKLLDTIAKTLGFISDSALLKELSRVRAKVRARFASLAGEEPESTNRIIPMTRLFVALDEGDENAVVNWVGEWLTGTTPLPGEWATALGIADIGRHLLLLARRPDWPLGVVARERFPHLPDAAMRAILDSANPEQAARLLASFFSRFRQPIVFTKLLAEDVRALRSLVTLFGASAFLGGALALHPELLDGALFTRITPNPSAARAEVAEQLAVLPREDASEADVWVGALRRAKQRVTMQVGMADLGAQLSVRESTRVLSEVAESIVQNTFRLSIGNHSPKGIAAIAMGKLGGREIGYGSDLDLFFVYDDTDADEDASERYIRIAQRVLRFMSMPHDDGPGYELDTRLRPSGNHGLLVVSLGSFARYHGLDDPQGGAPMSIRSSDRAQDWERQALVKARFCAGDPEVGARCIQLGEQAAYERGAPDVARLHHLRSRMERELGREKLSADRASARYDLKVGRGGIVDVEFAVQYLQMKHGEDARVRTTETEEALTALESCGFLDPATAAPLRDGYRFLRKLEQRLRVLQGTSVQQLAAGAHGLVPLARALGFRDGPEKSAADSLLDEYASVTRDVRAAYLQVLGLDEANS